MTRLAITLGTLLLAGGVAAAQGADRPGRYVFVDRWGRAWGDVPGVQVLDTVTGDLLKINESGVVVVNLTKGTGAYRPVTQASLAALPELTATAGTRFAAIKGGVFDSATGRAYLSEWGRLRVYDPVRARILSGPLPEAITAAGEANREAAEQRRLATPSKERALGYLRGIYVAQARLHADPDRSGEYGTLAQLTAANLVEALPDGAGFGYRFEVIRSAKDPDFRWQAIARPVHDAADVPHLMINQTGQVFVSSTPFTPNDACEPHEGATPLDRR